MTDLEPGFLVQVRGICRRDPRYKLEAYLFVYEALGYTVKTVADGEQRHVSGRELLEGIRLYAVDRFGPLTLAVFHQWGVRQGEDFGEIVFNLVENGLMGKTDDDTRKDFSDWLDFDEIFGSGMELDVDASLVLEGRPRLRKWKGKV